MWQEKHKELFKIEENGWFDYQDVYDDVFDFFDGFDINTKISLVEIGLWQGMSFSYLVSKSKEYLNYNVYGVDTFGGDPDNPREQELISGLKNTLKENFDANMKKMDLKNGIDYTLIQCDSVKASDFVGEVDFVFIDGGHSEPQVRKDINAWLPKVNSGGIIAGHDYNCPSVKKVVEEMFGTYFVKNNSWIYYK